MRILITGTLVAMAFGAVGCSTASWASTRPSGPSMVLEPSRPIGSGGQGSLAAAPEMD